MLELCERFVQIYGPTKCTMNMHLHCSAVKPEKDEGNFEESF